MTFDFFIPEEDGVGKLCLGGSVFDAGEIFRPASREKRHQRSECRVSWSREISEADTWLQLGHTKLGQSLEVG